MKHFKVTWIIDINANTAREAAEAALAIQRDVFSDATYFTVENVDEGTEQDVDLEVAQND